MAAVKDAVRRRGGLRAMGLRAQHLLVLLALADHENDKTGDCNPSSQTIGLENDQHHQRVRVLWGQLRQRGFIIELKRVQVATVGESIYWGFNEEVFRKTNTQGYTQISGVNEGSRETITHGYTQNQEPPETITQGYTQKGENHPPLHKPLKQSEMNQSLVLPSSPVQDDLAVGEGGIQAEEGPKLPVTLCLLGHLNRLKVTRPRRKQSWPKLEGRLQGELNPDELVEVEGALSWIFDPAFPGYWSHSAKHWRDAITDPLKQDQLGFFVKWAWKILEDFQVNRAADLVNKEPAPKGKVRPKAIRQHDDDDEEETGLWTG
jgi:hypothetical protein